MDPTTCSYKEQVDVEYLKILRLMKPYIMCIMSNEYVQMIKLWLDKLGGRDYPNKQERNKYVKELGIQAEEGVLRLPFTVEPPEGELPPYEEWLETVMVI